MYWQTAHWLSSILKSIWHNLTGLKLYWCQERKYHLLKYLKNKWEFSWASKGTLRFNWLNPNAPSLTLRGFVISAVYMLCVCVCVCVSVVQQQQHKIFPFSMRVLWQVSEHTLIATLPIFPIPTNHSALVQVGIMTLVEEIAWRQDGKTKMTLTRLQWVNNTSEYYINSC